MIFVGAMDHPFFRGRPEEYLYETHLFVFSEVIIAIPDVVRGIRTTHYYSCCLLHLYLSDELYLLLSHAQSTLAQDLMV